MIHLKRTAFSLFLVLLYMSMSCATDRPTTFNERPSDFPEALVLLKDAKDIRYFKRGGTFQLAYYIMSDYPATAVLKPISGELERRGWRALKDNHLNPGLPSSHVIGWEDFEDRSVTPAQYVYQWIGDWEDDIGNVVTYMLRYQNEYSKMPDLKNLLVFAVFAPTDIAKREREWALRDKKRWADQNRSDWPDYVRESMAIPHRAETLRYAYYWESYQVTYTLDTCYPPNSVIVTTADFMKEKGWQRLIEDPVNPGQKLSYALNPDGMSLITHPWNEYWKDTSGNVLFYGFTYGIPKLPIELYYSELAKSCVLRGAIIFYPAEAFAKFRDMMLQALHDQQQKSQRQDTTHKTNGNKD